MKEVAFWNRFSLRLFSVTSLLITVAIGASLWVTLQLAEEEFLEVLHGQFHDRFHDFESGLKDKSQHSLLWADYFAKEIQQTNKPSELTQTIAGILEKSRSDAVAIVTAEAKVALASDQFFKQKDDLSDWPNLNATLKKGESSSFIHSKFNRFFLITTSPLKKTGGALLLA